jgi:drug/metabolite transporter (DMT)-like permease
LLAGLGMFGAYALALAALARAAAAPVAAVRESSVVIATALAALVLHERVDRRRWAGAVLVAAGVAAIALPG